MEDETIPLPDTIAVKHGWLTFPEFTKPIRPDGSLLWAEKWTMEALESRKRTMGPIAWAQEMENNPVPEENSYFTIPKFEACYHPELFFEYEYRGSNPVFIGVDSQTNPDPKKSSDFGCLFVIEFLPDTEDRRILWIERGRWGFRIADLISQFDYRYRPSKVLVENNQAQDYIVQHLRSETTIPVQGFTTSTNKPDIYIGIPYLAATVESEKWIIPRGGPRELELTDQWVKECLEYGQGHSGDVLMAAWFANDGARELTRLGLTSLPSAEDVTTGERDFTRDHTGVGDIQTIYAPIASRRLDDLNSARGFSPNKPRPKNWRPGDVRSRPPFRG